MDKENMMGKGEIPVFSSPLLLCLIKNTLKFEKREDNRGIMKK